jgi:3-oxoacyl-[acyl-carrier-protein] synthase-3
MLRQAAVTGWGHYLPKRVLTNHDLGRLVDTNDAWIRKRTGISERRIAGDHETTASMCVLAAQQALASAELTARDLDLVICATTSPDHLLPPTGCLVQEHLGASRAGAFDVNAACTGFLYGLAVGAQFVQAGTCERVLIVGGETLSRFVNWKDRNTCVLFGDGAGAIVLEVAEEPCGVLGTVLGSRGDLEHSLAIEAGGAARPTTVESLAAGEHFITMRGNEVFKMAVRAMTQAATEALAKADLTIDDVRMVVPHQANLRIIKATQEALGLPWDRFFINVDRYGNTAAASVPIALSELFSSGTLEPGDNLLLVAFGGGFTWAAATLRCADVEALLARRGKQRSPVCLEAQTLV